MNSEKKYSLVSVVRCLNYEWSNVERAVGESLDYLGGIKKFVKHGDKVLLKVNLLAPTTPEEAVITHPQVVKALIYQVKDVGGIPWIGDSSGGPFSGLTSRAFEISGLKEVAQETGAILKNFDVEGVVTLNNPNGIIMKKFHVARPVVEADVCINMPKLKIHELLLLTGAVKNLVGVIPGGGKKELHQNAPKAEDLAHAILDLFEVVKPRLQFMDAVVGLEGKRGIAIEGAGFGSPRQVGLIIASADAVAMDVVAAVIMGYNPLKIESIRVANERGVGESDLQRIRICGEELDKVKIEGYEKASNSIVELIPPFWAKKLINQYITSYPAIDSDSCKKCGTCQKSCPVDAIRIDSQPRIDLDTCIRCYCCHELCTHAALELKRPLFARYLLWKKRLTTRRSYTKNP